MTDNGTRRRGRWGWLLGIGVVLIVASVVWMLVAVPALVKYPTDVNAKPHYAGTFTLYVDPSNGSQLAKPTVLPMTIDRTLRTRPKASSSTRAVVDEGITQKAGPLTTVQDNTYVIDRSTVKNLADPRTQTYGQPGGATPGTYRVNLPFGTHRSGGYFIYKNETGSTYKLSGDYPVQRAEGLRLYEFKGQMANQPVTQEYLRWLGKFVPLPATVTIQQLKPQLAAAGLDVDKLAAALVPVASPEDRAALLQATTTPVKLQYLYSFDGTALVEPTTGAELSVAATERLSATPDPSGFVPLLGLLTKYRTVPAVGTALQGLATLSSAPSAPLFEYTYKPTSASLSDIAGQIKHQRNRIRLADRWVPGGLLVLGIVGVVVGLWGLLRPGGDEEPGPVEPAPSEQPVDAEVAAG